MSQRSKKRTQLAVLLMAIGVLLAAFGFVSLFITGPSSGTGDDARTWLDVIPSVFLIVAGLYSAFYGGRMLSR